MSTQSLARSWVNPNLFKSMPRIISAGAVIFRQKNNTIKYLLLYRKARGHSREAWTIPRGKIESDETEKQTVVREVREETGIKDLKFIGGFKEEVSWFFKKRNEEGQVETMFKTAIFYLAQTETKEVKLSHEHQDFAWLEFSEAYERITFDAAKEVLKKANDFLNKYLGRVEYL